MKRREFLSVSAVTAAAAAAAGAHPLAAHGAPAGGPVRRPFNLRYGPHPGMFGSRGSIPDQIAYFASEGFLGFEDNGLRGRSAEEQRAIAGALEAHAVHMGIFVAHSIEWGRPTLSTGDRDVRDRFVAEIGESVELARRMNTKVCTVVPGTVANQIPMGIQTANVVEALKQASGVCEASGLVMVCEPLNWRDHPGLFLRYSDHAYEIMKAVGSPSCKILFDIYHQQATEGNLIENIGRCWDEIGYFQIGDNPGRQEPGTGEVNYRNVFKFIHGKGYTGVMGMEHGVSKDEATLIEAYRAADAF